MKTSLFALLSLCVVTPCFAGGGIGTGGGGDHSIPLQALLPQQIEIEAVYGWRSWMAGPRASRGPMNAFSNALRVQFRYAPSELGGPNHGWTRRYTALWDDMRRPLPSVELPGTYQVRTLYNEGTSLDQAFQNGSADEILSEHPSSFTLRVNGAPATRPEELEATLNLAVDSLLASLDFHRPETLAAIQQFEDFAAAFVPLGLRMRDPMDVLGQRLLQLMTAEYNRINDLFAGVVENDHCNDGANHDGPYHRLLTAFFSLDYLRSDFLSQLQEQADIYWDRWPASSHPVIQAQNYRTQLSNRLTAEILPACLMNRGASDGQGDIPLLLRSLTSPSTHRQQAAVP